MKEIDLALGIFVKVSIVLGTIAAAVKLKIYRLFSRRFKSSFSAMHCEIPDVGTVFEGNYRIENTGERPIDINKVHLAMFPAKEKDRLLFPDEDKEIVSRMIPEPDQEFKGLFNIEAGEISTFTLRCRLIELPEIVFIRCQINWPYKRTPSPYYSF